MVELVAFHLISQLLCALKFEFFIPSVDGFIKAMIGTLDEYVLLIEHRTPPDLSPYRRFWCAILRLSLRR
jgi:hypothetical protein